MRALLILLIAVISGVGVYLIVPDWVAGFKPPITRGRRSTPYEAKTMAAAKQALEKLPDGRVVFDAPKTMKLGDVRTVHAAVGVNIPVEKLQRYVGADQQKVEAPLKVAYQMSASLTGSGFKITPLNSEKQAVADGYPTFWSWNAEPLQEGEQQLEVTLYVMLPAGSDVQQRIDSFNQSVSVSTKNKSWLEWLTSSEQAVTATKGLLAAVSSAGVLGAGCFRWLRRKRPKVKLSRPGA